MMLVSGAALCTVGAISPTGLLAEEVVEENLTGETATAQTEKRIAEERRDRREDSWDRREDRRDKAEDRWDRKEDIRDRKGRAELQTASKI